MTELEKKREFVRRWMNEFTKDQLLRVQDMTGVYRTDLLGMGGARGSDLFDLRAFRDIEG